MLKSSPFTAEEIAAFWQQNPCGSHFINATTWETFFTKYDEFKYSAEPHILEELHGIDFAGKRLLEIGLGQGAEAQRVIDAGAIYNGIDITEESVRRVKLRCELFHLRYESVKLCPAEKISFPDSSFDIVFSHGVIHHSPRILDIVDEIHRVLKPGGKFVVMLYHRNSINYYLSIKIVRRVGLLLLFIPGMLRVVSKLTGEPEERVQKHKKNFAAEGLNYLRIDNFIHKSTDGPDNVFSSVYSEREARQLFSKFSNLHFRKHLLNERHLPILRHLLSKKMKRKIESRFGWHLWCEGIK